MSGKQTPRFRVQRHVTHNQSWEGRAARPRKTTGYSCLAEHAHTQAWNTHTNTQTHKYGRCATRLSSPSRPWPIGHGLPRRQLHGVGCGELLDPSRQHRQTLAWRSDKQRRTSCPMPKRTLSREAAEHCVLSTQTLIEVCAQCQPSRLAHARCYATRAHAATHIPPSAPHNRYCLCK